MNKKLVFLLLASFAIIFGACSRDYVYTPSPVDKGLGLTGKLDSRRAFYASTITYGTSGTVNAYDTLSIYKLNDSTITFRNDTLHYKAYSIDTVNATLTFGLSRYAITANGNITTATFTYYYGNDSISYFYSTKLYPLFTSGYEVSMHTL